MNKTPSVMVCVTTQKACERLIEAGAEAAQPSQSPLHVVHVAGSRQHFFNSENEGAAMEHLFNVSKQYGADMTVLRSDDVAVTLADYAREHYAQLIIFGQSPDAARPGNIIDRVRQLLADTGAAIAVQAKTND